MEGIEFLCSCCKNKNCSKNNIVIEEHNGVKKIKCLDFIKDNNKAKEQYIFDYKIRSDRSRRVKIHRKRT